jgi:hypothetical protein
MPRSRFNRTAAIVESILLATCVAGLAALAGCSDSPRANPDGGGGGNVGAGGSAGAAPGGSSGGGSVGAGGGAGTGSGGTAVAGAGGVAGGSAGTAGAAGSAVNGGAGGGGSVGAGGGGTTAGAGGVAATAGAAGTSASGGIGGALGGAGGLGGAAGSGAAGTAPGLAPPAAVGLAVVNTDYASTSLSLLSLTGALSKPDCAHTTTTGTGSTTISNDAVLPSQPQRGGKIVLIDRGNTALTFIDPATCAFTNQISAKGGFNMSNPHDVVILRDDKAYVTRYEKNAAAASPTAAGDDVLILDPRSGAVAGHIDLGAYIVPVAGATIQARPDRALIAAGKVVVSLNELSGDFSTYAEGRIVVIDPATDQVAQSVAMTGLKNCEGMTYLAAAKLLLVVCGGSFGVQDQVLESGIALVDMSGSTAVLTHTISAVAFNDRPLSFQAISGTTAGATSRAFVTTLGAFASGSAPAIPDQVFVVDLGTGVTTAFGSSTAYDLGAGLLSNGQFLLPDGSASAPRIHVYDIAGTPTEAASFVDDTVNGLPPRQVEAY